MGNCCTINPLDNKELLVAQTEVNADITSPRSALFQEKRQKSSTPIIQKSLFIQEIPREFTELYTICGICGHGNLYIGRRGPVYRATYRQTGQTRAVKILTSTYINSTELQIPRLLDHPNMISAYQYFHTHDSLYVVSEYCEGGTLENFIKKQIEISETKAAEIMHQILSVLSYLHRNHIVHNDIQPKNILFSDATYTCIKLIDYEFSEYTHTTQSLPNITEFTLPYASPECIKQEQYDQKTDIWNCGVILYYLLCKTLIRF